MAVSRFGEEVKNILFANGMSQRELAEKLYIDPSTLTRKLRGADNYNLTTKDILNILEVLFERKIITFSVAAKLLASSGFSISLLQSALFSRYFDFNVELDKFNKNNRAEESIVPSYLERDAVEALSIALNDEEYEIRYEAVHTLGKIGSEAAIKALIETIQYNRYVDVKKEAIKVLGDMRFNSSSPYPF